MAHLVKSGGLEALAKDPFVDFTVKCAERSWQVHRTTLCGDSEVLMLHCTQMIEAEKRELDLQEADPKAVECMVTFQYLGSYNDFDDNTTAQASYPSSSSCSVSAAPPVADFTIEPDAYHAVPYPQFPPPPPAPGPAPIPIYGYDDSNDWGFYPPPPPPGRSYYDPVQPIAPTTWHCARHHSPHPCLTSSSDTATITNTLLLNINVFELAQRLSLPRLEDYAVSKLMSRERYFASSNLSQVLNAVFDVTGPDDTKLRYPIFLRCVDNHGYITAHHPDAIKVLTANEPLGWAYALKVQGDLTGRDEELRSERARHKTEMRGEEKKQVRETRELRVKVRERGERIERLEDELRELERKVEKSKKEGRKLRQRFNYWSRA